MESKINGKLGALGTPSIADSTESRVSGLIEAGFSRSGAKLSADSRSPGGLSSVRNFGNSGALIHGLSSGGDCAVFKDCNVLDASKQFYERNSEFLKSENAPWEDFVKVQRAAAGGASETLLGSSSAACKLIKDEKEPSVIMDTPCSSFDPSPEISALDICCDGDRKQHLALGEGEQAGFGAATAVVRPGLDGSPNFLIDLNRSDQLLSPARTDSRCALQVGKAAVSFDSNAQQVMFKTEGARWQMQSSPAEPQFWCQSAGTNEETFTASSYDGIQNQSLTQRNPSPFSGFPG